MRSLHRFVEFRCSPKRMLPHLAVLCASRRGIARRLRDVFVLDRRSAGSARSAENGAPLSRKNGWGFGGSVGWRPLGVRKVRVSMEPVTGLDLLDESFRTSPRGRQENRGVAT